MSVKVLNLYKPQGLTPLQLIKQWQKRHPEYNEVKLGMAGRLDPMAEGVMLLLVGEENKNKQKYLKLDKTYEFEALFGLATDTYDILGKITKSTAEKNLSNTILMRGKLKSTLKSFLGQQKQKYPPYSTKTVRGKALFEWARLGKIDRIKIPEQKIEIYSLKLLKTYTISGSKLKKLVTQQISKVEGDFRQKQIIKKWQAVLSGYKSKFLIAKIRLHCSSGTYVRGIVNDLGKKLGYPALALKIVRTAVEKYHIKNSLKIKNGRDPKPRSRPAPLRPDSAGGGPRTFTHQAGLGRR